MTKADLKRSLVRASRDIDTAIKITADKLNADEKIKAGGKRKARSSQRVDTAIMDKIANAAMPHAASGDLHRAMAANGSAANASAAYAGAAHAGAPVQAMRDELNKAFGPRHKLLKRSGMRPLAFDGVLIAEANSHCPGTTMWYEINIYRKDAGGFVAEVKLFLKAAEQKDAFRAQVFDDVSAMSAWLESHDPADNAVVNIESAGGDVPLVVAALGAIRMRQAMEEARREYRYLVGELLFELGIVA